MIPWPCVFGEVRRAQELHVRFVNVNAFSDAHFVKHEHPWKVLLRLTGCLNNIAEYDTIALISDDSYCNVPFLELLLAFPAGPGMRCCRNENQL